MKYEGLPVTQRQDARKEIKNREGKLQFNQSIK